jgi:hypothetical protein
MMNNNNNNVEWHRRFREADAKRLQLALSQEPNAPDPELFVFAFAGMPVFAHLEYLAALVLNGADPRAPIPSQDGQNALHLATHRVREPHMPVLSLQLTVAMLDDRGDINQPLRVSQDGNNALAVAANMLLPLSVRLLLEVRGADPNVNHAMGVSLRQLAYWNASRGSPVWSEELFANADEILRMLIAAGGDPTPHLHLVPSIAEYALALFCEAGSEV